MKGGKVALHEWDRAGSHKAMNIRGRIYPKVRKGNESFIYAIRQKNSFNNYQISNLWGTLLVAKMFETIMNALQKLLEFGE